MSRMPELVTKAAFGLAAIVLLCFLLGYLNLRSYQARTAGTAVHIANAWFANKGQRISQYCTPDYTMGIVETIVTTADDEPYYVVVGAKTSWWVEFTALNYVVRPSMDVLSVERANHPSGCEYQSFQIDSP